MKSEFKIANDLQLPLNIITSRTAALGGNGSGKTYFVTKVIEELLGHKGWVIALDPVGVHYGVRLNPDGTGPSKLTVPIFGGLHADVPLTPESGELVANLLCDRRLSAILDVSQFSDSELNRFATDFGQQFEKRMKAKKHAVLLVLEEAHEFIPQNPQKGEERKLHIFSRLAKNGRNHGVGILMASPRPQDIAKKVFNLTQNMFAFQMTGLSERKTVKDWCDYINLEDNLSKTLPLLEVGRAFVASPRFLKFIGQVKILPKKTFDSSATPEFEGDVEPVELFPIDITDLEKSMKGLIEQKKQDDPRELRKSLKHAQDENHRLNRILMEKPVPVMKVPERVEVPVSIKDELDRLDEFIGEAKDIATRNRELAKIHGAEAGKFEDIAARLELAAKRLQAAPQVPIRPRTVQPAQKQVQERPSRPEKVISPDGTVSAPEQAIVDAIAMFSSIGQEHPLKKAVASLAGYSMSGTFTNYLGAMRRKGYIDYKKPKTVSLTSAGHLIANKLDVPLTVSQMQDRVMSILSRPQAIIVQKLIEIWPGDMSKQELADACGYSLSGTFTNYLGDLKTKGIIGYPSKGRVSAEPFLFLE